jgi:hypothetical protein
MISSGSNRTSKGCGRLCYTDNSFSLHSDRLLKYSDRLARFSWCRADSAEQGRCKVNTRLAALLKLLTTTYTQDSGVKLNTHYWNPQGTRPGALPRPLGSRRDQLHSRSCVASTSQSPTRSTPPSCPRARPPPRLQHLRASAG